MTTALLALPSHLRRRLASAIEGGLLTVPCTASAIRSVLGLREGAEAVAEDLAGFAALGASSGVCVAWIRSLEEAVASGPRLDLVWSGPEVEGLHARDTRRVFEELIGAAERSVWMSSYAYFDGPRAFEPLARRMEERSELQATLLLNIQRARGDRTAPEALVRRFADRFWGTDWPGRARPRVYYDPRSIALERPDGVLHAKVVVRDDEVVLITSANLTEAAFDRNVEAGLLAHDRSLALSVSTYFQALIDRRSLSLLPGT